MDDIIRDALERFQNVDPSNANFQTLFGGFCSRIRIEHEKIKGECFKERARLDNANNEFQLKLKEVLEGMKELERSSEIGIGQFLEAKKWFRNSTERFQQEYEKVDRSRRSELQTMTLMKEIDRVKLDASRLLSTVRSELDFKIQSCTFFEPDYEVLKNLLELLVDSIHQLNSKINLVDQSNLDLKFDELNRSVKKVEKTSDELMLYVTSLQENQKQNIKNKLMFDPYDEKFKYLENRKTAITALEIEREVNKTIENFIITNRENNGSLEFKDIRPFIVNVTDLWKNSYDQEIQRHINRLVDSSRGIEEELSTSQKIQETMEQDLDDVIQKKERLAGIIEKLEAENKAKGEELETSMQWHEILDNELKTANETLKREQELNACTLDATTVLQNELVQRNEEVKWIKVELEQVKNSKMTLENRVRQLENCVNANVKLLEDAKEWQIVLESQLKTADDEKKQLEERLEIFMDDDEVEELEKKLEKYRKTKKTLEVKLEASEEIKISLQAKLEASEGIRRQLELEIERLRLNRVSPLDQMMERNRTRMNEMMKMDSFNI